MGGSRRVPINVGVRELVRALPCSAQAGPGPESSGRGGGTVKRSGPLSPWAFVVRNPGKSIPIILVIMLAVLLIAGIVAIMNSIPLSIQTVYGYSRYITGATPRGDMSFFPDLKRHFDQSPLPIERKFTCRTLVFNIRSIVGPWPFVLYGMHGEDIEYVAGKIGPTARPKTIIFTDELPKTRSGKIMRRLLRDVAEGRALGDTTTLADPAVVAELKKKYEEE